VIDLVFTGGRDHFPDREALMVLFDTYKVHVHVGCARGVDAAVRDAATACGVCLTVYKADWDRHGKAAGHIRNRAMLEAVKASGEAAKASGEASGGKVVVVHFPGGRGTQNCVDTAKTLNLPTISWEELWKKHERNLVRERSGLPPGDGSEGV
jgi:hypothetical protein